ncbi:MAG: hypothetical protein ACYDBQ_07465 [Thermoplasmatota archaeon]
MPGPLRKSPRKAITSNKIVHSYDSATFGTAKPMQSADLLQGGMLEGDVVFQISQSSLGKGLCFSNGSFDAYCVPVQ